MTESGEQPASYEIVGRQNVVAILDAGAQYGMDIEQQVKRLGHDAIRLPFDTPIEILYGFGAVILSGGPESVNDPNAPRTDPRLFQVKDGRPPMLGVCYGDQLINHELGGVVQKLDRREDGYAKIHLGGSALASGIDGEQQFIMSHGDTITELAPGFRPIAYSGDLIAAIANDEEKIYGVQFHPEVSPPAGPQVLKNFLEGVSGLEADYSYSYEDFIEDSLVETREFIGNRPALVYLSGGVDSSAVAKLLERALPMEQLYFVLVDHGFMRDNEVQKVKKMLADANIHITIYDASQVYKTATTLIDGTETLPLNQVSDPEVKRKIMGDTFINIQEDMADKLGIDKDEFVLVMGSLYTDLIESGSKHASDHADTIKTHHNDTELVRQLREQGRVFEPWRFIQKDDVRAVGKLLDLPEEIYNRQPFPGPGLAIRIICGDTAYITEDNPWIEQSLSAFNTDEVTVSLAPIQTVGVQGDGRTYGHLAVLNGARNWNQLKQLANEIPKTIHGTRVIDGKPTFYGINRVAYVFGDPFVTGPDTITPTHFTDDVVELEKTADTITNQILEKYGLDKTLSQVPVILTRANFGEPGKRSVAIRTFKTVNFKTGDVALPGVDFPEEVLDEIVTELLALPGICRVMYDLTSKPPATTEWE